MNSPIRRQETDQDSLFFKRIYREELKWYPRVREESELREPRRTLTIGSLRLKILKGVFLSLLTHSWHRIENKWIFIQFELRLNTQQPIIVVNGSSSSVIGGYSLQELDGL